MRIKRFAYEGIESGIQGAKPLAGELGAGPQPHAAQAKESRVPSLPAAARVGQLVLFLAGVLGAGPNRCGRPNAPSRSALVPIAALLYNGAGYANAMCGT
jgi:hypothetical protein